MNKQNFKKILIYSLVTLFLVACHQGTEPTAYKSEVISIKGFVHDQNITNEISDYKEKVDHKTSRVIGYAAHTMLKGQPESPLSNFVADIILEDGKAIAAENNLDVPVMSYTNNGGLRTPIAEGAITVADIYKLMPFENKLVIVGLKSNAFKAFLDYLAMLGGEGVSGIRFKIKNGEAVNIMLGRKALVPQDNLMYYIVTTDYLANGGGGKILKNAEFRYDSDLLLRDAIINHIEKIHQRGQKVKGNVDGRIEVIQ